MLLFPPVRPLARHAVAVAAALHRLVVNEGGAAATMIARSVDRGYTCTPTSAACLHAAAAAPIDQRAMALCLTILDL